MGAMLKVPMAENCTMPVEFLASAEAGDTVMLSNCRLDIIIMERPPQETVRRRVAAAASKTVQSKSLRIDTSKSTAVKGKR